MSHSIPSRVTLANGVISQKLRDEVVLLNMDNQQCYSLNPTAAVFWENLVTLNDTAAVRKRLCSIYGRTESQVTPDLNVLIGELMEAGLLVGGDASSLSQLR